MGGDSCRLRKKGIGNKEYELDIRSHPRPTSARGMAAEKETNSLGEES